MEKRQELISRQNAVNVLMENAPEVWTDDDCELGMQNQHRSDVVTIKAVPSAELTYESVKEYCRKRDLITYELFHYLKQGFFLHCDTDSVKYIGGDNNGCRPQV